MERNSIGFYEKLLGKILVNIGGGKHKKWENLGKFMFENPTANLAFKSSQPVVICAEKNCLSAFQAKFWA